MHRSAHFLLLALCLFALLCGCSKDTPVLEVQVVTGLVPGPEFASVLTEVFPGTGTEAGNIVPLRVPAAFGDGFAVGKSVARFSSLASGTYTVWVHLYRPNGQLLIERRVQVVYSGSYVLRVHLTRDCLPSVITCPEPGGSAEYTECLAGHCVDPRCNPDDEATRMYCPAVAFCNAGPECTDAVAACASNACVGGVCTPTQLPGTCALQWCDPSPSGGCMSLSPPMDAGVDAGVVDAGVVDAAATDLGGETDAGRPCGMTCIVEGHCERRHIDCTSFDCVEDAPGVFFDPGSLCATDSVCSDTGECVSCVEDAPCSLGDCMYGVTHCDTGAPVCAMGLSGSHGGASPGTPCRLDHVDCAGDTCDANAVCATTDEGSMPGRTPRTCTMVGAACTTNCLNGDIGTDGVCAPRAGDFAGTDVRCGFGADSLCDGAGNCVPVPL